MQLFATERLFARLLCHQDLTALTEILSDPEVMKYSIRGVCDKAATKKFIDWCIECYSSIGMGPWALVKKDDGALVGFCGISPQWVANVEEYNLGYRLARQFWHQGFATEAVKGVLDYVFAEKKVTSVVVIIDPEHKASIQVSEKTGFRHYTLVEFHGKPTRLYRMTCQDRNIISQ